MEEANNVKYYRIPFSPPGGSGIYGHGFAASESVSRNVFFVAMNLGVFSIGDKVPHGGGPTAVTEQRPVGVTSRNCSFGAPSSHVGEYCAPTKTPACLPRSPSVSLSVDNSVVY